MTNTNCTACGFTLAWHPITTPAAKTQVAYCPAKVTTVTTGTRKVANPAYTFRHRYSRSQYLHIPTAQHTEWVPNVDRNGAIHDRSIVSPTFTSEQVREMNATLNTAVAA